MSIQTILGWPTGLTETSVNAALLAASSRAFSVSWSWGLRVRGGRAVCILSGFRLGWIYLLPLQFVYKGIPSTHGLFFTSINLVMLKIWLGNGSPYRNVFGYDIWVYG